ncbi:MAG TPA: PQQ-binding-like beta-propeller repeat protein, partial [Pirellulaceae bacterium]|nr:PQQ-binding-like beta-propeller repeat protein [Pirellulaceae bacterium]
MAKEVLPPIAAEPQLSEVHAELAPLLSDMAAGLADTAARAKNAAEVDSAVAQAREALTLANDARLVPGSLRPWQRLAEAEESLAVAEYSAKRSSAQDAALAAIRKAAGGNPEGAYAARSELVLKYPDLAAAPALRDAFQEVAKAEAARVKPVELKGQAETVEAVPEIVASMAFAAPLTTGSAPAPGRMFFAQAGSSVWALDGASGKLLWRRPSDRQPAWVSPDAGSDVLVVDWLGRSLSRVKATTGALVWRRELDSPIAGSPLGTGADVFIATRAGQIIKFDAASGNVANAAQLPQPVGVAPVAAGGRLFQLADHSHLYTLSAADLSCEGAIYLGHAAVGVAVPPLVMDKHLVIAENSGAENSTLHVVALGDGGLPQGVVQRLDVSGLVLTPPVVLGKHLAVLTDRGAPLTFEITKGGSTPLQRVGDAAAVLQDSLARYGLPIGSRLLVGENGLRLYAFDESSGNLTETWTAFADDTLLAPPQQAGEVLFCVRREPAGVGAIAAAVQATTGKPLWQTRIAVPLADGLMVVSSLGDAIGIDPEFTGSVVHEFPAPAEAQNTLPRITTAIIAPGSGGILVPAGNSSQLFVLSKDASTKQRITLPGPRASPPIVWEGKILAACSSGDVVLLNPADGRPMADPLVIPVRPGSRLDGGSLAAGESGPAVISDGRRTLRLVNLETTPRRHLVQQTAAELAAPVASSVAVLGQHAFIVDQTGELRSFAIEGLRPGPTWPLGTGGIEFGPA